MPYALCPGFSFDSECLARNVVAGSTSKFHFMHFPLRQHSDVRSQLMFPSIAHETPYSLYVAPSTQSPPLPSLPPAPPEKKGRASAIRALAPDKPAAFAPVCNLSSTKKLFDSIALCRTSLNAVLAAFSGAKCGALSAAVSTSYAQRSLKCCLILSLQVPVAASAPLACHAGPGFD